MKNFIVYNSDGKILKIGVCLDSDLSAQANENELIMEGIATPDQMIQNGNVVDKAPASDEELNAIVLVEIRIKRTRYLNQSDWTQMVDSPLNDSKKAEWVIYRQALRDLPESYASTIDYDDVTFPTPPLDAE